MRSTCAVDVCSFEDGRPSSSVTTGQWLRRGDIGGAVVAVISALLLASTITGIPSFGIGMFIVALAAVLPCLPPFIAALQRSASGLSLVLLFFALSMSMLAAYYVHPSMDVWLQAKG